MHTNYVQLPPDGVGKKVITSKTYLIPVSTTAGIVVDNQIQNQNGSVKLLVKQINSYSKVLYCMYVSSLNEGASLNVGDSLYLSTDLVTPVCIVQAGSTLSTPEFYYANMNMNVSYDNPYHGQVIDSEGQAFIRFAEGSQSIDSNGNSKFSTSHQLGFYSFATSGEWFADVGKTLSVNGAVTFQSNDKSLLLSNDATSGSSVLLQTNKYHYYNPGNGLYASMLVKLGDTGKTNLVRRWGYYDNSNGVFFQLSGTTLSIVYRSSSTGTIEEVVTAQVDWTDDKLDGSGISKEILDVTKINRYWFDFSFGNKTRIGIYGPRGNRIICHVIECANVDINVDFSSLCLPLRVEQINQDTVTSSSEMKWIRGNVQVEGIPTPITTLYEGGSNIVSPVTSATWLPLISLRPQSNSNHALALIKHISVSCVDALDDSKDGRVKLEVYKNATLTGANFNNIKSGSSFEYDKSATAMSGGIAISEHLVKGTDNFKFDDFCDYLDEYLIQDYDGTQNTYTLAVKAIKSNVECMGAITWEEYHI